MKTYSLSEMKDKHIGPVGTSERDEYEYELRMEVLGKMIKTTRRERNLTQEELASIIGVSRQTINAIEKEKFDPSLPTSFLISQLFELPIEKIFLFEKSKESEE